LPGSLFMPLAFPLLGSSTLLVSSLLVFLSLFLPFNTLSAILTALIFNLEYSNLCGNCLVYAY